MRHLRYAYKKILCKPALSIMNEKRLRMATQVLWRSSPSQFVNAKCYLLCGVLVWTVFPIFVMFWRYLKVKSIKYTLTEEILEIEEGVFNKTSTHIELYRIKDYIIKEPFLMRIFGLGDLEIITSDKTVDDLTLYAIKDPKGVKEDIRDIVEKRRDEKGVKEVDFR